MRLISVGDLSKLFVMRRNNSGLRQEMRQLSGEVTTGIRRDIPKHLSGNLTRLAKIEQKIMTSATYLRTNTEAKAMTSGMQSALDLIGKLAKDTAGNVLSTETLDTEDGLQSVAKTIESQLASTVSALNTDIGGRFIFSGTKIDSRPLISKDDLITQAETVIAGVTTAEEAVRKLRDWFEASPGGNGFIDAAYQGETDKRVSFAVEPGRSVTVSQTAVDDGPRKIMFGLTLGVLVSRGAFNNDHNAQRTLMQAGGKALLDGNRKLTFSRAELGANQQIIEHAETRHNTASLNLKIERSNLVSVDRYEAGSRLVRASAQLDSLFAVTARLSNLSLANHL